MSTKTIAIRLEEDVHTQLSIIAQLADTSLTEEIRTAIEAHIEQRRDSGTLATKASDVLDDIDRDAATRRSAIETLFGTSGTRKPRQTRSRKTTRGGDEPPAGK